MKRKLCGFLVFAIILTTIAVPSSVAATDSLNDYFEEDMGIASVVIPVNEVVSDSRVVDYIEGDDLIASFDASNADDLAKLISSDGEVKTETFDGETYAYTSKVSNGSTLKVPQILPVLSDNGSVYVKLRLHAAFDNTTGKTIYVWTERSGNARAGLNLVDGALKNKANNDSYGAPGVDVILEMKAGGFGVYTKTVGDDEWSLDYENKGYETRTGDNTLNIYYGLAVNNVKVYKKQTPEVAAVNAAAKGDASDMKMAIEENAETLGIDLSLLEGLNELAVYTEMLGETYTSAADVVDAFEDAVELIASKYSFDGDYVEGYRVYASFDASNAEDMAKTFVADGADGSKGSVLTAEYAGDTYVYASGGSKWIEIPFCPGFLTGDTLYIKFRTHAITDTASGDKSAYFYFANTHRIPKSLDQGLYKAADDSLSLTTSGAGMDNIYAISDSGAWTLYARQVGSDGPWVEITSGQTTAHTNNKTFKAQCGLGVSNIIAYKRLDSEFVAINAAAKADAAAMKIAMEENYEAFGIDLSLLAGLDELAVYAEMLGKTYETAADVAEAFEAAIDTVNISSFDGDYVEGEDKMVLTLDTSKITSATEGATVESVTYDDDTYVYVNGTNAYANIPVKPTLPTGEDKLYLKFRTHATNDAGYAHTYMYFHHSGSGQRRITGNFSTVYSAVGIPFSTESAGIDNIYEITATGYKHYAKPVGSEDGWIFVRKGEFNTNGEGQFQMGYSMGISDYIAYTKLDSRVKAVNEITSADELQTAVMETYSTAFGTSAADLEGVVDVEAVFEKLVEKRPFESLADIREKLLMVVAAQKSLESVLTNPSDILAQNDKVYVSETFDALTSQIGRAENMTVGGGYAVAEAGGNLFLPVDGGMKGRVARFVFKPDSETTAMHFMLFDVWGGANVTNRYYKHLTGLPNAWHEVVMYAVDDSTYMWYRNIDANGAWQTTEPSGKSFYNDATYVGVRVSNTGDGVIYDEVIAYNDLYSTYSVAENGSAIELDGKLYYGTYETDVARNAQFIFASYNKKYGYTSVVDVDESRIVVPTTEEIIDRTYTYNASSENYSVMFWDSIDNGIILGEMHGYKTPNSLGEAEPSTLAEGEIVIGRHFNDAVISGNLGEDYVNAPVTVSVISNETNKTVAVAQTTLNLKGAFAVNVGIDASVLNGGSYTVNVRCKGVTATETVELCGTDVDYKAIRSADGLANEIQNYVDSEVLAFFNQGDSTAYDKFMKLKGKGDFDNFFEFKVAVDNAVSYTKELRELLVALNAAVTAERWSDVMNLITIEYRELLELPTNPAKGIKNEKDLFKRMIKDGKNKFIVYETAEEIVDSFNDALDAQKSAETSKNNGGGGSGGGSGLGFGKDIIVQNKPSQEKIDDMIETAESGNLKDIAGVPWANDSIILLYSKGIVNGDGSGYFRPDNSVKREEFLKMILLAANIPLDETGDLTFEDVERNSWYFVYVNTAYKNGIITGMSETEFGIGANITRADMVVMMKRILDKCNFEIQSVRPAVIFDDYEKIPDYAGTSITTLYMAGLVEGTGNNIFAPANTATKAEAAVAINRIMQLLNN